MCGIFGVVRTGSGKGGVVSASGLARQLFLLSESRGKEASGFVLADDEELLLYKTPFSASAILKDALVREAFSRLDSLEHCAMIGHARLVTNGSLENNANNQPVHVGQAIAIHNGIIVNDASLWKTHPALARKSDVDTEAFLAVLEEYRTELDITSATQKAFSEIRGVASIAAVFADDARLLLATNNGSLYVWRDTEKGLLAFSSELRILESALKKEGLLSGTTSHISPMTGELINLSSLVEEKISLHLGANFCSKQIPTRARVVRDMSSYDGARSNMPRENRGDAVIDGIFGRVKSRSYALRRCIRCILPETFPRIEFDDGGTCNYCRYHVSYVPKGTEGFREKILAMRRGGAAEMMGVDCIMGFSGGRDSCYGLHVMVKELGIRPVAYTYDWGMITDLGRRNQSRLCERLGIEHVIVSADIRKKRQNIRKNVLAWAHSPDLGMVPLFMAGDKQYFYHLNKLAKDCEIDAMVMCESPLERTHFKQGFCGIKNSRVEISPYDGTLQDKIAIAGYYASRYISNSRYINSSVVDTLFGYLSYYFIPHKYSFLFDHVPWNESTINSVLLEEYDWELSPDTKTTWRIGDGTASFYNLIYFIGAGFTENDALRSNQIREGMLTRDQALVLVDSENSVRYETLHWYLETIDLEEKPVIEALLQLERISWRDKLEI